MKTNNTRAHIKESLDRNKQYYINNSIPIVIKDKFLSDEINIQEFVDDLETTIPQHLLQNIEIIYIGDFPGFSDRTAAFSDGAIYVSNKEMTNYDILEDIIHEIAHSVEPLYASLIYDDGRLEDEFLSKRKKLQSLLDAEGYKISKKHYMNLEYSPEFDNFLSDVVGYPTLLSLTMGLFASPYGATSLQEYFANGFEKYYLEDAKLVKDVSPILYNILYSLHTIESDN